MKNWIYILIFVVIVTVISGLIIYNAKTIEDIDSEIVNIAQKDSVASNSNWKKYISDKGFSFEVPENWNCSSDGEKRDICISIETKEKDKKAQELNYPVYVPTDLIVYIHEMAVKDYLALDGDNIIPKKIKLDEKNAYEYTQPGFAGNYTIVTEFNNGALELSFGKSSKEYLGEAEKHIIDTFQFIE